ncbi:hypothetical protein GJ496_010023 [Pomphorhynchus laevis]|nr:hypothetical protein GJ496_010023 [Pomphorhynchus laevis]
MTDQLFNVPIISIGKYRRYRCDMVDGDQFSAKEQYEQNNDDKLIIESVLHIPLAIQRYILHSDQTVRLQADLNCKLAKMDNDETNFRISSKSRSDLISAETRLQLQIYKAKQRTRFTHFVAVNLNELQAKVDNFKKQVIYIQLVDKCLFQKPERFHLTLCTLVLLDDYEVELAKRILGEIPSKVSLDAFRTDGHIEIKNLEIMNDDPGCVDVLYAKVVDNDAAQALIRFTEELKSQMSNHNLCLESTDKDYGRVKLHATLMNSKFTLSNDNEATESGSNEERKSFDARKIFNQLKDYNFGKIQLINKIAICKRSSFDQTTGYYETV